jgi:hypothetical protein
MNPSSSSSSSTDRAVRLFPCGCLTYTPRAFATNGECCRETRPSRLALLFVIRGPVVGRSDVVIPTPRRSDPAWDV